MGNEQWGIGNGNEKGKNEINELRTEKCEIALLYKIAGSIVLKQE